MAFETMQARFDRLWPHVLVYGPPDDLKRPALIMFHGCGGVGSNLLIYAALAARMGVRVFIVDSYAPRGWSRKFAASFVCIGLRFRGHERSGDVLAMVQGIAQRPDVDKDQILLAGWSHGAWAVMDLMTQALKRRGEACLEDPSPEALGGLKGLFLAYPYVNFLSRSIDRPWLYKPKTLAIISLKDHLASYDQSLKLIKRLRAQGVMVDTLSFNATHAFDESGIDRTKIMKFDQEALETTLEAVRDFIKDRVRVPA